MDNELLQNHAFWFDLGERYNDIKIRIDKSFELLQLSYGKSSPVVGKFRTLEKMYEIKLAYTLDEIIQKSFPFRINYIRHGEVNYPITSIFYDGIPVNTSNSFPPMRFNNRYREKINDIEASFIERTLVMTKRYVSEITEMHHLTNHETHGKELCKKLRQISNQIANIDIENLHVFVAN